MAENTNNPDREILIEVAFDTNDLAARAAEVRKSIVDLRTENKALAKDVAAGTKTSAQSARQLAENNKQIKINTSTLKSLDGQLQAATEQNQLYGDSIDEQRARLSALTSQYTAFSKAQRESAQGQELRKEIKALSEDIKEAEGSFGDFRRNVGNYPKSVTAAIPGFDMLNKVLANTGTNIQTLATGGAAGFKSLGKSALAFGKLFITPPLIIIAAVLGAIVFAVQKTREAFQKNNEAATRLQAAFAVFQPVLRILGELFSALATGISYVAEWVSKLIVGFTKLLPFQGVFKKIFGTDLADAARDAQNLVVAIDQLRETERNYTEESAKRNLEIARLQDQAIDKINLTNEQRIEALNKAIELQRQNLEDEKNIAAERLRILEQTAAQEVDTSNDTLDKISSARAALYNAERNYFTGIRRLRSQAISAEKEITTEAENELKARKKLYEEAEKKRKETLNNELAAVRKLEDEINKAITDAVDRQVSQTMSARQREIDDLKRQLETGKNLTETARKAIADTILQIEINSQAEIEKIRKEQAKKLSDKALADEIARIEILLNAARRGSENQLNLRLEQIELLRKQALSAEKLTQQEILNINARFDQQILEQQKERRARESAQMKQALLNDFEIRRQALFGQETELALLALEQARLEQENLLNLDAETKAALYENQELYEAAVLASNERVRESTIAVLNTQTRLAESQAAIFGAVVDAIDTMFSEIAGDNAAFASFLKTLALAQASIELGLSIAAATRTASTGGDPYTVAARIISAVAGVVGAFVSVTKSIKDAQIPKAPKFATGGIVPGRSYTGDNVAARVNSREMIINLEQQKRLFDIANGGSTLSGIDYGILADITADAVSKLPPPILDYREYTTFTQNVVKYNEYADL